MEKFEESLHKYLEVRGELYRECEAYILKVLQSVDGHAVSFETDDEDVNDEPLRVTYDGGNHPEYGFNPFSRVHRIYLKDDQICLEIEDDAEYELSRVFDVGELAEVALRVKAAVSQEQK